MQWVTAVECPGRSHATLNAQLVYEDLPQSLDDPKQPWRGAGRRLVVSMHHAAGVCLRGGTGASDIVRLWRSLPEKLGCLAPLALLCVVVGERVCERKQGQIASWDPLEVVADALLVWGWREASRAGCVKGRRDGEDGR